MRVAIAASSIAAVTAANSLNIGRGRRASAVHIKEQFGARFINKVFLVASATEHHENGFESHVCLLLYSPILSWNKLS